MIKTWLKRWNTMPSQEQIRQQILVESAWPEALQNYLNTPLIAEVTPLHQVSFLALDFETTGLDAKHDKILSIGMVDLTLEGINLSSTEEILLNHGAYIKAESARINGITPQALEQGCSLEQGMMRLLERAQGKVLLAHSAIIEQGFLQAFAQQHFQLAKLPCHFVDTLQIEKRFSYAGKSGQRSSFQLDDLRRCYHLPDYHSHSAASDALACAELFMVQSKKLDLNKQRPLNTVLFSR
ncbi:DNA polymerase III subunit epsilon [Vibrio vulnificus]|uniref:exonuclease domain-containing protein n=1 Tax=Vibrio vulnificus TaxID=672 RepID=UPI001EE9F4BF|nr:exonuclease domain-containing protein [Vibrio vulnificus]EGQ8079251.1 DNA polymerase III subunit epsilon [Vibrio vulnificus]EHH0793381.1 DNA polymerase III subunit epsilon [Vibrio vulnificus]ELP5901607.1 DNA polymerase III subunit epsilon [Vibrio vulnificus]ELR8704129.1 DNA polymerase III subunit epsilon [Vibrio vulnificus]ELR8772373.1 DNA polymerase III subunit epsilon [Vibrio vulnificus]